MLALSLAAVACGSGRDGTLGAPLVSGLTISELSLFQGLKSSLMKDGAATMSANVPVVADRPGLLRVYVSPSGSYAPHEVIVRVDLTQNGAALPALEQTLVISGASTDGDLASTVNFDLPAATLSTDLSYAVSIHETGSGQSGSGSAGSDTAGAQYPAIGQAQMGAVTTGIIKITLLPVVYGADGSNRTPGTADADLQRFRDRMLALYPISDVQITVGPQFAWDQPVAGDGTGWDELLNAIMTQRQRDGAAPDEYYYGLFAPASSFGAYCDQGCVTGLSTLSQKVADDWARASIGLSYTGSEADSAGTFVHEVGHAHGRQHAPCDVNDPDRRFPYKDGEIGVFGYDAVNHKLLDPTGTARDMMGYCSPIWISDYTYKALFDRIVALAALPDRKPHKTVWRSIVVGQSGPRRGELITTDHAPVGDDKIVERVVNGQTEQLIARFYPFDHLPGGILLLPETDDVGTLKLDGRVIR